jgi:hypothetical protein
VSVVSRQIWNLWATSWQSLGARGRWRRSEKVATGAIGVEEALGMPWRFEPLHVPLPLPRGVVRVLGTIGQILMLAML